MRLCVCVCVCVCARAPARSLQAVVGPVTSNEDDGQPHVSVHDVRQRLLLVDVAVYVGLAHHTVRRPQHRLQPAQPQKGPCVPRLLLVRLASQPSYKVLRRFLLYLEGGEKFITRVKSHA